MPKKVTIFSSNLNHIFGLGNVEIWFLYYWKSCGELNFLKKKKKKKEKKKKTNPKSIGILSRKLEPKYKIGAKDNTSSTSSSNPF